MAIKYADEETEAVYGSGLAKGMAPMFQGTGSVARGLGPEFSKQLTFMGTFFGVNYNLYYDAWKRLRTGKQGPVEFMHEMTWLMVVPALVTALIVDQLPDEEDDESALLWSLEKIAAFGLSSSMIARNFVQAYQFGETSLPGFKAASEPIKLAKELNEAIEEGEFDKRDAAQTIRSLEALTPIYGGSQAARILDYLESEEQGNEDSFSIWNMLVRGRNYE